MVAYDFDRDVFCFPIVAHLHGEDVGLMVEVVAFSGGMFYIVQGAGTESLHILCTFDYEEDEGKPQFTVMNGSLFDPPVVSAILEVLEQPLDTDDPADSVVSYDWPF
jgi:hypothetical protein